MDLATIYMHVACMHLLLTDHSDNHAGAINCVHGPTASKTVVGIAQNRMHELVRGWWCEGWDLRARNWR